MVQSMAKNYGKDILKENNVFASAKAKRCAGFACGLALCENKLQGNVPFAFAINLRMLEHNFFSPTSMISLKWALVLIEKKLVYWGEERRGCTIAKKPRRSHKLLYGNVVC